MSLIKKLLIAASPFGFLTFATPAFAQATTIIISPPPNIITDIGKLISAIVGAILVIATLAAFIYLLLGGFQWITSGGDKAGVEAAQKRIQAAIIGLVIVFAAWAIMILIGKFLGIPDIFKIEIPSVKK